MKPYLLAICALKDGAPQLLAGHCIAATDQEATQFALGLGTGRFPGAQVWATAYPLPFEALQASAEALGLKIIDPSKQN